MVFLPFSSLDQMWQTTEYLQSSPSTGRMNFTKTWKLLMYVKLFCAKVHQEFAACQEHSLFIWIIVEIWNSWWKIYSKLQAQQRCHIWQPEIVIKLQDLTFIFHKTGKKGLPITPSPFNSQDLIVNSPPQLSHLLCK